MTQTHKCMTAHFLGLEQPPQELRLFQVLFMMFNATFNNILVHGGELYWGREPRVPGENHPLDASH